MKLFYSILISNCLIIIFNFNFVITLFKNNSNLIYNLFIITENHCLNYHILIYLFIKITYFIKSTFYHLIICHFINIIINLIYRYY